VRYRSRVEARWAIFLHELGVRAQYEPEGFDFDGTRYLPDFYIIEWDIYIEVKWQKPSGSERFKCQMLATHTGKRVLLVIGDPSAQMGEVFDPNFPHDGIGVSNARIASCRKCPRTVLALSYGPTGDDGYGWVTLYGACGRPNNCTDRAPINSPALEAAIYAACAYRFDEAA
jgi:hypothetical protein